MAGVFPVPVKTSGRKQWTLYNGYRRFGSQLAEDGCAESQVVLAKQLLDEKTDLDIDRVENARLGVYWLIKASEQGHEEATTILRHCLSTGQGITEHNYLDVKACLAMSHEEKIARHAAKQLFASMSGGEDFITSDQLHECMLRTSSGGSSAVGAGDNIPGENSAASASSSTSGTSTPDWKSRSDNTNGGQKLTEEMLVSAASTYARGELPLVHRAIFDVDNSDGLRAHRRHRYRCYFFLFPILMLTSCCHHMVETISRQNFRYLFYMICSNIQGAVLFWVVTHFDMDAIIGLLPTLFYFGSLIVMLIATCQALSRNNYFHHFRRWSYLFIAYSNNSGASGNLNASEAEYQYCCKNLAPYGTFFVALLLHLILTPFMLQTSSSQSEITVVGFICSFLTLYHFTVTSRSPSLISTPLSDENDVHGENDNNVNNSGRDSRSKNSGGETSSKSFDLLALFSFAVNVLAKYPYETDAVVSYGWRFLDVHVPTFASYVVGNGVEFCLNFRALFYLVIPAILIKMAARDNWRGTYTSLIPHCMSLAWWQITVLSSQGATWYGLIRSALAVVGVVLFLPLAGLATVLFPIAAAGKVLFEFDKLPQQTVTTVLCVTAPLLLAIFIGSKKSRSGGKNIFITTVQVLLLLLSLTMLIVWSPQMNKTGSDKQSTRRNEEISITWAQYQQYCATPIKCSHLSGLPVRWEGRVSNKRLIRIYNPVAHLTNRLPHKIQSVVKCWYGDKYSENAALTGDQNMNNEDINYSNIPSQLVGQCHLSNWDRYDYEIDVIMSSGLWRSIEGAVTLVISDNSFRNITESLTAGDHVWFTGSLISNNPANLLNTGLLDRDKAFIDLEQLGCMICKDDNINNLVVSKNKLITMLSLYSGIKAILNFLFNPLVIFR